MTEIIWINTYRLLGSYIPSADRIEISDHLGLELKQYVLEHEQHHAKLWKKYGYWSLPFHIFHDWKHVFLFFSNPKHIAQVRESKKKRDMNIRSKWRELVFSIVYQLAMIVTIIIAGFSQIICIIRLSIQRLRKQKE